MKTYSMLARAKAAINSRAAHHAMNIGSAVAVTALVGATMAHAGTDTTFSTATTQLTTWTTGSMGKMAAVAAVAFGVIGAVARFDWKLIAGGVGIGLAGATGPGIVQTLLSASF